MKRELTGMLWLLAGGGVLCAAEFAKPVRLEAGGEPIRVESPGYACPAWADLDGDGRKDLLVGQFRDGKIKFYRNLGGDGVPKFATGKWLMHPGKKEVVTVPGVW